MRPRAVDFYAEGGEGEGEGEGVEGNGVEGEGAAGEGAAGEGAAGEGAEGEGAAGAGHAEGHTDAPYHSRSTHTHDTHTHMALPSGAISKDEEEYWQRKTRSGGAYVPPARLAQLQRALGERGSEAHQRVSWEALKKSLNGLINKLNVDNIKDILVELFGENLVRGRGLLVRGLLRAQAAALPFTPVHAAAVAVLNAKLPDVGELALRRLVAQFRRAYRRNDKAQCLASVMFVAHLVNQRVAHELVALQLLTLLLERPTDDSVEIAVAFVKECGAFLAEHAPRPASAIFERLRVVLHEGAIDRRVQYMVEVLFQIRKDRFRDLPALRPELDLVEEDEQLTHFVSLDDDNLDTEDGLNVFSVDPDFLAHEAAYAEIRAEILGDGGGEKDRDADGDKDRDGDAGTLGAPDTPALTPTPTTTPTTTQQIADMTGTNLVNLRKTIYLTIMSSVDFEECGHKLLKIAIPAGLETELTNMLIECCSQERSYLKFYGLLGARLAQLSPVWCDAFVSSFHTVYAAIDRLETNRIRNVAHFFGHLLATDALPWAACLGPLRLTEEDTTSASRILLKFLVLDLVEALGQAPLLLRLYRPSERADFLGLFPERGARELRFAINFFTAIGLGPLTERMRDALRLEQQHVDESLRGRAAPPSPSPERAGRDGRDERAGRAGRDGRVGRESDEGRESEEEYEGHWGREDREGRRTRGGNEDHEDRRTRDGRRDHEERAHREDRGYRGHREEHDYRNHREDRGQREDRGYHEDRESRAHRDHRQRGYQSMSPSRSRSRSRPRGRGRAELDYGL